MYSNMAFYIWYWQGRINSKNFVECKFFTRPTGRDKPVAGNWPPGNLLHPEVSIVGWQSGSRYLTVDCYGAIYCTEKHMYWSILIHMLVLSVFFHRYIYYQPSNSLLWAWPFFLYNMWIVNFSQTI